MERLVSREELDSPSSSIRSSPDLDAVSKILTAKQSLNFVEHGEAPAQGQDSVLQAESLVSAEKNEHEEMMEFRLFASGPKSRSTRATNVHKIRVRSPSPVNLSNAGFVVSQRPLTYYFATPASHERRECEQVALSGDEIKRLAQIPHFGASYPWRVLHLPASGLTRQARAVSQSYFASLGSIGEDGTSRRRRLGKKARIKRRVKIQLAAQRQQEQKVAEALKDANDREKRTNRNREKKIKRRERERAKKAALGMATAEQLDDGSGDDDSAT